MYRPETEAAGNMAQLSVSVTPIRWAPSNPKRTRFPA